MGVLNDECKRNSLQVAPLAVQKTRSRSSEDGSETTSATTMYAQTQFTPPATPNGSREKLSNNDNCDGDQRTPSQRPLQSPKMFHNFLRAFYPFVADSDMIDSTVTLPLNEGDVILVHSIHINGWADGTLLSSGARGWLPTNYCEPYDPEDLRSLLKALTHFWDLLRSADVNDCEIFGNQEFMKGIIAGVRHLLVSARLV